MIQSYSNNQDACPEELLGIRSNSTWAPQEWETILWNVAALQNGTSESQEPLTIEEAS